MEDILAWLDSTQLFENVRKADGSEALWSREMAEGLAAGTNFEPLLRRIISLRVTST